MDGIDEITGRFSGLDIQYRAAWRGIGWREAWRVRIVTNKNERDDYRIETWGPTASDAIEAAVVSMRLVDLANHQQAVS